MAAQKASKATDAIFRMANSFSCFNEDTFVFKRGIMRNLNLTERKFYAKKKRDEKTVHSETSNKIIKNDGLWRVPSYTVLGIFFHKNSGFPTWFDL